MRRLLILLGVAAGVLVVPAVASAHPLGNFTVNRYSGLTVSPRQVRVDYVVDMAEIPTFQEAGAIDADGDGSAEPGERAAWAAAEARDLVRRLALSVGGREVRMRTLSSRMELLPGQAGLPVLRLEASFAARVPASGRLEYRDGNDPGRIGWREMTAVGEGVALRGSGVPAVSVSRRLRAYPEDLLSSPLDVRRVALSYGLAGARGSPGTAAPSGEAVERPGVAGGAFAQLVGRSGLSLPVVLLSLLLAFAFGALHALGPGHGKTLMAGALVTGGGLRQAVWTGLAVSAMHTASVAAVGVAILVAERTFAPERVYPFLGLAAGVVAAGLGAWLLVARLAGRGVDPHTHSPSRARLGAIAVSGGILPSPTAVVVLVAAVALHRVAFGIALIAAFSLGLAASLIAVGMLAVRAGAVLSRRLTGRAARVLPLASAAAILSVGVVLLVGAAGQLV